MGELLNTTTADPSISVNIFTKEEDGVFVAHCLEFDIVATGATAGEAEKECVSLICAQVEYAFAHNNLDNLYHSAPAEVWAEFLFCKGRLEERRYRLEKRCEKIRHDFILPPWLTAKTRQACHA
jgi:hypothetical protein